MNHEEFVSRILAGESPEDIIAAVQKAADEVRVAAEAKAKDEAKSKKLDEISMAIAHALNDYAHVAGIEDFEALRGAEVRQLLDEFLPVMESIKGIKVHVAKADPKAVKAVKKIMRPEDVFTDFFKSMGI
jgi:molecular chaperone GrpE (heat shock protein)